MPDAFLNKVEFNQKHIPFNRYSIILVLKNKSDILAFLHLQYSYPYYLLCAVVHQSVAIDAREKQKALISEAMNLFIWPVKILTRMAQGSFLYYGNHAL